MTSTELESLARAGRLKREAPTQAEFDGLLQSGSARLKDAQSHGLAPESQDFEIVAGKALSNPAFIERARLEELVRAGTSAAK